MTLRRALRLLAATCAVGVLAGCNVDTSVTLNVEPNGSGTVSVTVILDSDALAKAPGIKDDLRVADLEADGWTVDGPDETDDGGLRLVVRHSFDTPQQATTLLGAINGDKGPLHEMALTRSGKDADSQWNLAGRLEINGGLEAFIDSATLQSLGVTPYAEQVEDSGLDLGAAVTLRFVAALPGSVVETTGQLEGTSIVWRIPMDGTTAQIATRTENVDVGANVARVVQPVLIVLLVIWVGAIGMLGTRVRRAQAARRPTTHQSSSSPVD